jgi:hypothetical protein
MPTKKTSQKGEKDKHSKPEKELPQAHKALLDKYGIIRKAAKVLPDKRHRLAFLEALDEIETYECYRTRRFPKTEAKILAGIKPPIYRAYIEKTSGWRLHFRLNEAQQVQLADVLTRQEHDDWRDKVTERRWRYE